MPHPFHVGPTGPGVLAAVLATTAPPVEQIPRFWPLPWPLPPHLSNRSRGSGQSCWPDPGVLATTAPPVEQVPGFWPLPWPLPPHLSNRSRGCGQIEAVQGDRRRQAGARRDARSRVPHEPEACARRDERRGTTAPTAPPSPSAHAAPGWLLQLVKRTRATGQLRDEGIGSLQGSQSRGAERCLRSNRSQSATQLDRLLVVPPALPRSVAFVRGPACPCWPSPSGVRQVPTLQTGCRLAPEQM